MHPLIIGGLISWVVNVAIGFFVFFSNPKKETNRYFFFFNLSIGCWSVGSFLDNIISDRTAALWVVRGNYFFAVAIIPFFLLFVFSLMEKPVPRKVFLTVKLLFVLLVVFLPTKWFIRGFREVPGGLLMTSPNIVYYFFVAYFVMFGCYGFVKLALAIRGAKGAKRTQLMYVEVAYIIALMAGLDYFLSVFGVLSGFPVDDYILVFSFLIMAYAILKYHVMDIRIVISRLGVSLAAYSFVFAIPFYMGHRTGMWPLSTALAVALAMPATLIYRHFRIKAENFIFKKQREYQRILLSASETISSRKHKQELLEEVSTVLFENISPSFVAVYLLENDKYVLSASKPEGADLPSEFGAEPYFLKELRQRSGIILDFHLDDKFVPLVLSIGRQVDNMKGFIFLGEKKTKEMYSHEDIDAFETLLNQVSLALENIEHIQEVLEEQKEKERLKKEMEMAKEIQQGLLPKGSPEGLEGFKIAGLLLSATEVAGDYYDYVSYSPKRLGIVVADVSGKGLDSGMVMSMTKSTLRTLCKMNLSPRDMILALNSNLCEQLNQQKFISLIYAEYSAENSAFTWAGAGHEHIIVRRKGGVEVIKTGGIVLGMITDIEKMIEQKRIALGPGDRIVLYTDGVTEARSPEGAMFSLERLAEIIKDSPRDLSAQNLLFYLQDKIRQHIQDAPQYDDITLVVLGRD